MQRRASHGKNRKKYNVVWQLKNITAAEALGLRFKLHSQSGTTTRPPVTTMLTILFTYLDRYTVNKFPQRMQVPENSDYAVISMHSHIKVMCTKSSSIIPFIRDIADVPIHIFWLL